MNQAGFLLLIAATSYSPAQFPVPIRKCPICLACYLECKPDRSTTLRFGLSKKLNARIGDNAKLFQAFDQDGFVNPSSSNKG